jgi:arabinose-5-phosphate isomerase
MSAVVTAISDVEVARSVLGTEAAGLHSLAASLDRSFDRAIDLLAACTGRVVASGMGKSGHVARKVAATLASTGSPAIFVHPAEASHGDLGMVQPGDALLLFSNSGETTEMADLVAHARRFGLPLIAVTGRAGSTLAAAADVALVLPRAPEACAVTSAPTTSTTMQMALGDALAVVLLNRRGFTASDFQTYHPGGRLGAQLRRVRELMHEGDAVPLAGPGMPMQQALLLMTGKGFGCVGVVEAGRLIGIVTDGDLRRAMGPGLLDQPVRAVMTADPRTIRPDALAADALREMNDGGRRITSLFVVDATAAPLGILHIHDLLRAGVA